MVSKSQMYVICPFCKSKYKKNGEPRKNATPLTHIWGNSHSKIQRTETRGTHCCWQEQKRNPQSQNEFKIHITEETAGSIPPENS